MFDYQSVNQLWELFLGLDIYIYIDMYILCIWELMGFNGI